MNTTLFGSCRRAIAAGALMMGGGLHACTSFAVYGREPWYGMNFDYAPSDINLSLALESGSMVFRATTVAGVRIAGMNDRGLFANLQILDYNTPPTATTGAGRVEVQTLYDEPIRSLGTVAQVQEYINGRRVAPSWGQNLHMLFADWNGHAMVVEPYGSSTDITDSRGPFVVMTNFPNRDFINLDYRTVYGSGADRYRIAYAYVQDHLADFGYGDAFETLRRTAQGSGQYPTQVSLVFDPVRLEVFVCFGRDFERVWKISIPNETIETFAGFPLGRTLALNAAGVRASNLRLPFTATDATPPVIQSQPVSQSAVSGEEVVFSGVATGIGLAYQWRKGGAEIPGATAADLVLSAVTVADAGDYLVVVSNPAGTVISRSALLTVDPELAAPVFTTQPQSRTVTAGAPVSFTAAATGVPAPAYQWLFGGTPIQGQTAATLTVSSAQSANAGSYSVVATNRAGTSSSAVATLTVEASSNRGNVPGPSGDAGGGGGGAPGEWFLGSLPALAAARFLSGMRSKRL